MLSRIALRSTRTAAVRVAASVPNRGYLTNGCLPEDHQMLRDMCRKFTDEQLAPEARQIDNGT